MRRNKNISPQQRRQVQRLQRLGKPFREIEDIVGISRNTCFQAMKHVERCGTLSNVVRAPTKRKTSARIDLMIHRLSEAYALDRCPLEGSSRPPRFMLKFLIISRF